MKWTVEVRPGEMAPRWYGFAWRRWDSDGVVAMPVPFNLIAGVIRACWIWVRRGFPTWSPRFAESYEKGRVRGYVSGFKDGQWEERQQAWALGVRDPLAEETPMRRPPRR